MFSKRLISEMLFSEKHINIQNDTERLSEAYFPLLNIIFPI